ncbi:cytidine deaminase [Mycoplasmatota bacterium zrk1]
MNKLIEEAIVASKNAYTPYSKFNVGAAVELTNGKIITGVNVENASYGLTNCAERSALFSVYSLGYKQGDIKAMAVVADTEGPCSPCGACRQVMNELLPKSCEIYLSNFKGDIKRTTINELLPFSFGPDDL